MQAVLSRWTKLLATKGLAKYGLDLVIFGSCNSGVLWFGAGHLLFSFLLLSSTKVFQSAFVPGLTSYYSRTSPSLERYMQAMSTLRNIALLLLVGICLYFLYDKIKLTKEYSIVDDFEVSGNFITQPDSIRDKIALNNLVYDISALQNLEAKYIGIEGRESTQPDYLTILKKWADTNQLVKLTDHGNALVRSMAFQALSDKNYIGLIEIFKKHLNDKQTYNVHSGCVVEPVPVNIAFYRCIYPTLSSAEASSFKKELLKQYRDTYFEFNLRYL